MKSLEERGINVLYENYLGLFALDLLEGKLEKAKAEVGQPEIEDARKRLAALRDKKDHG